MTTTSIKLAAAAAIAFGGAGVLAAPASAAPMLDPGIAHASDLTGAKPEAVRWVCGPYRCWWRPGPLLRRIRLLWPPASVGIWLRMAPAGLGWRMARRRMAWRLAPLVI